MFNGSVEIGEDVLFQQLQGEVVLLNMASQRYYGLNEVGARMWELLLESGNVDAVTDRLREAYDTDPLTLRSDLERLIGELLGAGLLRAC
ncbi:MAG: PqqD family protein [Bryobacteraceae bacterium]|jgi:hypothetical protein